MQEFFFVKEDRRYVKINWNEIIYIEGRRNYLKIVAEDTSYMVHISIKRLVDLLPTPLFIRIHKSYIISTEKIATFDQNAVYIRDKKLPIGKTYKNILAKTFSVVNGEIEIHSLTGTYNETSRLQP